MRYFASLDANYLCTGIQESTGNVTGENIIEVTSIVNTGTSLDDFLERKCINGQWSAEKFPPPAPEPQPDAQAQIEALRAKDAEIILTLVMNDLM